MKRKKVGTITLALGLILLGVVLFINNFTSIAIGDIYKYWPVLLIGIGIEMFAYMVIYRQEENVKLRIDSIAVIFIIIAALVANNSIFKLDPKISINFFDRNPIVDGVRYKSELKETITKDSVSKSFAINKLEVKNSFGDVKLVPYDQSYIKVEALVTIKYNNEQAAREYLKQAVKISEGEQTQISVADYRNTDKNDYSRAMVDFIIYVPQGVQADVNCSFGDIEVQGITKDLAVFNQHGNIIVKDIDGNAVVKNSFGDIALKNIGGKAEVNNQHGDVEADMVNGAARLETSFGDIGASNIKDSLNVKNSYGKIIVKEVAGNADITSSFSDIEVSYITGDTIINDNNGSIEVNELKSNVQIKNSFGKIQYSSSNTANAEIYAKTRFGDIDTNLPINVTKSVNDYTAQGKTGDGKYKIELTTNNGEIEIK